MGELIQEEGLIVQEVGTETLYLQDKAQIDIQISSAKAFPRNITRAVENAIAIVSMDAKTASTCTYSVPRGGKAISGPSVHLAKIIAQQWKNMRIESRVIDIDAKHVTSQGICWDLENNIAIKTEVKRSIMTKNGRMNDDMITVTGNAGNSIALRNAIFAVVPRAVVDKVYAVAKQTITGDISDETKLVKRRTQVFTKLKEDYGVSEEEVLSSVGKASLSNITPEDLVVIIGIGQAIKDGDTTVAEAFRRERTTVDNKKEAVKEAKKAAAEKAQPEAKKETTSVEKTKSETTEKEVDYYTKVNQAKTTEELLALYPSLPKDDLDLEIAYSDKKRELANASEDGGLFKKSQLP
jgi:hypothetical protein